MKLSPRLLKKIILEEIESVYTDHRWHQCYHCDGYGEINGKECPACAGEGRFNSVEEYEEALCHWDPEEYANRGSVYAENYQDRKQRRYEAHDQFEEINNISTRNTGISLNESTEHQCPACSGEGGWYESHPSGDPQRERWTDCDECGGMGTLDDEGQYWDSLRKHNPKRWDELKADAERYEIERDGLGESKKRALGESKNTSDQFILDRWSKLAKL